MNMLVDAYRFGSGPPPSAVTWNPADKNSALALSGGDLVAVRDSSGGGASWAPVRATLARSAGKYQFRARFDAGASNSMEIGLANSTFNVATNSLDSTLNSWAMFSGTGDTYRDGTAVGTALGTIALTHWMDVAVDFDVGQIWFGIDGAFSGNPAAGTGARFTFTPGTPLFPAAQLYNASSQFTGAFSATDIGALISGFSAWE